MVKPKHKRYVYQFINVCSNYGVFYIYLSWVSMVIPNMMSNFEYIIKDVLHTCIYVEQFLVYKLKA